MNGSWGRLLAAIPAVSQGGCWRYTSAKPYREANDPLSDNYSDLESRLRDAYERGGEGDDGSDAP